MVSVNTDGSCKSNPGIAAVGGPHSWQRRTMDSWALSPFGYLFIITWRGLGQLIMDGLMLAWNLGSRRLKLEAVLTFNARNHYWFNMYGYNRLNIRDISKYIFIINKNLIYFYYLYNIKLINLIFNLWI